MAATLGEVVIGVRLDDSKLKGQIAATKGRLAGLGGTGGMGGAATAATITAQQRIANLTKSMGVAAANVGRWGRTMTWRATMPLALLGTAAVKAANTFEQSFARINAIAGKIGMSTEDAQAKVKELASTYGQAPQELADALYFVASAGVKASQVMSVVEQSAKGAATGLADSATIAQMLTTVMNNYGRSGFTAEQGLNVLTEAIKLGKAEPQELADSLANVIPMASALGVSFASMAGAVAQGTNAGLSAARAATGLRFILGSMQRPTNMAKEVLKDYGLTVEDVQGKFKELGATGGIQYLANLFDTTTTKGKEAFAVLMGGQRGLIIANALIGENYRNAARIDAIMRRSPNSKVADDAFAKATETNAFKFKKAMADLKVALIDLGETIVPIIVEDVLPVVKKLADGFSSLPDGAQKALVWSGIFLALAGPAMQLLAIVLRLGQGLGIVLGLGSSATLGRLAAVLSGRAVLGAGGAAAGIAGAGAVGAAETAGVAAGAGASAVATSLVPIIAPLIITAAIAATASYFEGRRDNRRNNDLTDPPSGKPRTGLLEDAGGSTRGQYNYSGVGGSTSPITTFDQDFIRQRLSVTRSLDIADDRLQRWADLLGITYTMTDEQAAALAGGIRAVSSLNGDLTVAQREMVTSVLERGDVTRAIDLLKAWALTAAGGLKGFALSMANLQASGVAAPSGKGGFRIIPPEYLKDPLAEHGAVIGLAGGGFLVTRPTFIRGNVLTGEQRKKEAVIPLEDVRGKRILAGAMSEAMGGASRGTVVVNVAGKVERPEDIKRELDWWMRSRGL